MKNLRYLFDFSTIFHKLLFQHLKMPTNPLLTAVINSLSMGLSSELIVTLDALPIEKLNKQTERTVFIYLLQKASESPLGLRAIKIIMERWHKGDIDGNLPETPVYFLMEPDIPQKIINLMVKALDNWNYFYFVYSLIYQDSSPEVEMAMMRLENAYGEQDPKIYQVLLAQIDKQRREEESYNHIVKEILERKLEEVSNYVDAPEWIVTFYGDLIPHENDPRLNITEDMSIGDVLPNAQEAADAVMEKIEAIPTHLLTIQEPTIRKTLKEEGVKTTVSLEKNSPEEGSASCPLLTTTQKKALKMAKEQVRDAFIMAYNSASLRKKVELLGDLAHDISEEVIANDEFLFSILGPVNPIYGMLLDPESTCCKYGGCRMFTCVDFENEDEYGIIAEEDPEEYIEWFTGACEVCHNKIAKKIYALRRPLTFGGWKGTFCSFKCLRSIVPMNDVLNHGLINHIEEQLLEIGIQDRIVTGEGEINNEELKEELENEAEEEIGGEFPIITVQTIPENKTRDYMA